MKRFLPLMLVALLILAVSPVWLSQASAQSKALKVFEFPLVSGCINTFLLQDSVIVRVAAAQEYDDVKPAGCYPEPVKVVAKKLPPPPPPVVIPTCPTRTFAVHFDFDKSLIKPAGDITLDELIAYLKGCQGKANIIISEGHCDNRGTDAYNIALGERRAKAVALALKALGIEAPIKIVSMGESEATGDHPYDRRVDIIVNP